MTEDYCDALIVGTGFAGVYALHSLLQLELNVKAIEAASDVGGTWQWSRYPGAMSDTWSHLYRYSFDTEYPLKRRYITQPEALAYLNHFVDKHDLRQWIKFNREMISAEWEEKTSTWRVVCKYGDVIHTRYLLTALGLLSRANYPNIPGLQSFKGEIRHTSAWTPELDLQDKRVGLIGVGASGAQIVSAIAGTVKSLHVFIRHAQYVIPSGDRELTPAEREEITRTYPKLWAEARTSGLAFGFPELARQAMALSPKDREEAFEQLWEAGNGLQFLFGGFSDLTTDPIANEEACKFLRRKIAQIVTDPQKRAVLMPKEPLARRTASTNNYYDQFNRENVFAVDIQAHPITGIEETGIHTADDKLHELDVIIFATGYDAMDGSYMRLDIQARNSTDTLRDRWKTAGPASYLGMSVPGFPNLLMINGPLTAFANIPTISEENVNFTVDLIEWAEEMRRRENRPFLIEATEEAQREWKENCEQTSDGLLFKHIPQWLFGQNVPGKKFSNLFYFGGIARFRAYLADVQARGFAGFKSPRGKVAGAPRPNL